MADLVKLVVIGLVETKYVDESVYSRDCGFDYLKEVRTKVDLYGRLPSKQFLKISFKQFEGECSSGWCGASWARCDITEVDKLAPLGFTPKDKLSVMLPLKKLDDEWTLPEDVDCGVFKFSECGSDNYYPCGFFKIKYDLFTKSARYMPDRVVYIFQGPSGYGKTYLTSKMTDLDVYETDSTCVLPDVIYADVVVIGNRYHHTLDEVRKRLFENPIVRICTIE